MRSGPPYTTTVFQFHINSTLGSFGEQDIPIQSGAMENVWARVAPVTCLHPGWTLLSGREAVLESWRTILANPNQPRIVGGGASVTVFGDAALVLCREVVSGSALYATNVFVREEGTWRMTHHHSGPVMVRNPD